MTAAYEVARILARRIARTVGIEPFVVLKMRKSSFLRQSGWFRSFRDVDCVDAAGNPIPWMTYGSIHFLEQRLHSSLRMFEYGSGNSTIWYSKRVASVHSVENSQAWVDIVSPRLPANAVIHFVQTPEGRSYQEISFGSSQDDNAYVNGIAEAGLPFDVVIVDGVFRHACVRRAVEHLSPSGVLVLDNTDLPEFRDGCDFLTEKGFRRIDFYGMVPVGVDASQTSIFYRSNNVFGI